MLRIDWKVTGRVVVSVAALTASSIAFAQYRYVGPDGRVTYSDQPPPPGQKVTDEKKLGRGPAVSSTVPLPYAVQQAISKYPVVLFTGDACDPCVSGRNYLRNRGVPFTEKTVTSTQDIAAFRQQSPDGTAPLLVVGTRKATGFAPSTWASLLDDAGYPPANTLPADYQNPAPTALSPATKPVGSDVGTASTPNGATQAARAAGTRTQGDGRPAVPVPPDAGAGPNGFRF